MTINILYLLAALVVGGVLTLLVRKIGGNLRKKFKRWAKLIQAYWIFVTVFIPLLIASYVIAFLLTPSQNIDLVVGLINQNSALIFAIFVGYFAFAQVIENRKDKFSEQGDWHMGRGSYIRAIRSYEQAISIDPTDVRCVGNVLELYLVSGDVPKWDENLTLLQKEAVEPQEKLVVLYLKTMKALMDGNVNYIKDSIKDTIAFVQTEPSTMPFFWDFKEIREANFAKTLTGDMRKMFDNYLLYLQKNMGANELAYEAGNYTI